MHIYRKSQDLRSDKIKDYDSANLDELRITQLSQVGFHYTDKRLVFMYDMNRKQFDPFLINIADEQPLISFMKKVPVDISEPVLITNISTVSTAYYDKYKKDRLIDDLTNNPEVLKNAVKTRELFEFSFHLTSEDLFISEFLQKKLYRVDWNVRPKINLEELRSLNSAYLYRFGSNIPNLALHLANILMNGSSLIMTNRSKRSVKTSSILSKIERMFFLHSVPGDGMYKLFSDKNPKGEPFDLRDDSNVVNQLMREILSLEFPKNSNYYLHPDKRIQFFDLYQDIRDKRLPKFEKPTISAFEMTHRVLRRNSDPSLPKEDLVTEDVAYDKEGVEIRPLPVDNKRIYLPGRKHIKQKFDDVYYEISKDLERSIDFNFSNIQFSGQNETTTLSREGSKQIRKNLFTLYKWLKNLERSLIQDGDNASLRFNTKKCKFLIYLNILIFKTGKIEPFKG